MKCEIGIDIIEISRVEKKFKNNLSFEKLIFTDKEMNQVNNKSIKYITLAGKWASKEAFSKALGTGIGKELHWKDIEISNDIDGKPEIAINPDIINKFGIKDISLSISHTNDYATAAVIISF